jgi:toxin ParE1/3/4
MKLSAAAETDLQAIFEYGLAMHDVEQANAYGARIRAILQSIERFPQSYVKAAELIPPQHIAPVEQHIILYELKEETVFVTRIRHHAEDWRV